MGGSLTAMEHRMKFRLQSLRETAVGGPRPLKRLEIALHEKDGFMSSFSTINFGRMPPGYRMSSDLHKLKARG